MTGSPIRAIEALLAEELGATDPATTALFIEALQTTDTVAGFSSYLLRRTDIPDDGEGQFILAQLYNRLATWKPRFPTPARVSLAGRTTRYVAPHLRHPPPQLYRVTLSGDCEAAPTGLPLADCLAQAKGVEHKDLLYLILAYEPETVDQLALSDQVRVLAEIIGEKVTPASVTRLLTIVRENDWMQLRTTAELDPWLRRTYSPLELLLRDFRAICEVSPRLPIDWLQLKQVATGIIKAHLMSEHENDYDLTQALCELFLTDCEQLASLHGLLDSLHRELSAILQTLT